MLKPIAASGEHRCVFSNFEILRKFIRSFKQCNSTSGQIEDCIVRSDIRKLKTFALQATSLTGCGRPVSSRSHLCLFMSCVVTVECFLSACRLFILNSVRSRFVCSSTVLLCFHLCRALYIANIADYLQRVTLCIDLRQPQGGEGYSRTGPQ